MQNQKIATHANRIDLRELAKKAFLLYRKPNFLKNLGITMEQIDLINGLAQLIREKQGEHLTVIDISEITTATHYSVILTVNSKVHAESITKSLIDYLMANGYKEYLLSKNIPTNNPWILIDASDIIVHIFEKEARDFYNLEKLYTRGKIIISE